MPPISSHLVVVCTSLFGAININPAVIEKTSVTRVFFISERGGVISFTLRLHLRALS